MEDIIKRYEISKLTIAIKVLLKTKVHIPEPYTADIDKLIRKLTNKISEI
jgi:hypothetical protein